MLTKLRQKTAREKEPSMSEKKEESAEKKPFIDRKKNPTEREKRQKWPIVLIVFCIAGAFFMFANYHYSKKKAMKLAEAGYAAEAADLSGTASKEIIELDGKKYRRNTSIRAILCIGVDTEGDMEQKTASGVAGQADGLFLVAQDMARDRVRILMIPRDTMTEITLFDLMGNELGKDVQHLTLAYAYGDGREKSCELLSEAVSDLCFGIRLDGYLAMNVSSIPLLNDTVGGVTVTVKEEGLEVRDPMLKKGNTVQLSGSQAEIFVRYRDITKSQTALGRMDRQKQYIQAYFETAQKEAGKDNELITRIVNDIEEHMITNMPKDQYLDMGLAVLNSQQELGESDFLSIPGRAVETINFDEFYPDLDELKRIMIELFYKEI